MRWLFVFLILGLSSFLYGQTCDSLQVVHHGEGTFYGGVSGSAGGNCGIPVAIDDSMHCAMNHLDYDTANACGAFVHVWGPKGDVYLKVVDRCPECARGDIDMTPAAFKQIAQDKDGRIDISWQYVATPNDSTIKVHHKVGTSAFWSAVQFRDLKYPLLKFEYKKDGAYVEIDRKMFNFWIEETGFDTDKTQAGPYDFRITNYNHQVLEINNVPFLSDGVIDLGVQFPDMVCEDCNQELGGTASYDNCGTCSGGSTGITPNSECEKDCNGYWAGTAYLDTCGRCVSGTTGSTPCGPDCNGDPGGSAFFDNCGKCVGGFFTGKQACKKDCNNEWGGTAEIDACNVCSSGSTGIVTDACLTSITQEQIPSISFWPNPASYKLYFNESQKYQLYDLSGQKLVSGKGNELSLSLYKEGFYFLIVNQQKFKLTIER